jgi:hypothetical protein
MGIPRMHGENNFCLQNVRIHPPRLMRIGGLARSFSELNSQRVSFYPSAPARSLKTCLLNGLASTTDLIFRQQYHW